MADGLMRGLLEWGSLASITGCLLATRISNRFGLARPLLMTLVCMALVVGLLYNGIDAGKVIVSILSFNLLWTFVDIFQMSSVANADHSGVFAALIPDAQGLGQIVGPNIAASLLDAALDYDISVPDVRTIDADGHGDLRGHVPALAADDSGVGRCFVGKYGVRASPKAPTLDACKLCDAVLTGKQSLHFYYTTRQTVYTLGIIGNHQLHVIKFDGLQIRLTFD